MFFGRERELMDLSVLMRKRTASLVTCRGRRRIGKSTLIREFGKKAERFLAFEGLAPRPDMSNHDQLREFSCQLSDQTDLPNIIPENWSQAFQLLSSMIRDEWTIVLLDEISWMGGYDPDFAGHLKTAWDRFFKLHPKFILVLCGSVSAWIMDNILENTGFVGRDSWDILLGELPLHDCNRFWDDVGERISTRDKFRLLTVTGGVPKYLEELDSGLSAEENIRRLCFQREGILFRDFGQIFSDVFGKRSECYRSILETLTYGSRSLSQVNVALGKKRSGHMSEYMRDLVLAGFVSKDSVFSIKTGAVTRAAVYRLSDNYSRFYLRYIVPRRDSIENGLLQNLSLDQLPELEGAMGLQFENLVLNNIQPIAELIGLGRTPILNAAPYFQNPTARQKGCQIDLLIKTKHSFYVVEVKNRKKIEFSVIDEVREKVNRLLLLRNQSVRTVLVYEGTLDARIETEGFFDFIIPFSRLLER